MKEKIKKWLKPVLFTAGGALIGLACFPCCLIYISYFAGSGERSTKKTLLGALGFVSGLL